MQSLNSVMALSFLQSYADTVLLFSNHVRKWDWWIGPGAAGGCSSTTDSNY